MTDAAEVATVGGGLVAVLLVGHAACALALRLLVRGDGSDPDRPRPGGYPRAGRLIGLLERTITYACIVAGAPGGIAALLLVKTAARFGETKDDHRFAEQFIVGTLVSIGVAAAGAVAVRWVADIGAPIP